MSSSSLELPLVLGRYVLHEKLASGGMATVFLGRLLGAAGFSKTVAIKRMHPHLTGDPDFSSMFLDEARLAARVSHPNVVPTLDVVAMGSELLIVMEYVPGESLARLVRASERLDEVIPVPIATALAVMALHGLHAAHEARNEKGEPLHLVHRDISPQNLLVGQDGIVRVLDFGIAKALGRSAQTRDGVIKGKPAYMAPEQLQAADVNRTVDVYAVAVVLWEMLTGQRLFKGDNDFVVIDQVLTAPILPPSEFTPAVPPALDAIVLRGLARDPAQRFESARAMAIALEESLPLATSSQISTWVERVAGQALTDRTQRVLSIESLQTSPATETLVELPAASPEPVSALRAVVTPVEAVVTPERRRGRWAVLAVAAVVLVVALVLGLRSAPSPESSSALAFSGASSAALPPSASVAPPAPVEVPASAAAATTSAPVEPPRAPPTSTRAAPVRRADDCAIPYTIGPQGRHRLKPQCIK